MAFASLTPAVADLTLPADAEDTMSSVSWSPVSNHLAAASWDGKVRVYDVGSNGTVRGVAVLKGDGPLLSCDWAKDGTMVLAGGADKKPHLLHCATGQQTTIGQHDAPIRSARFVDMPGTQSPIIATGSWDRTVKFWDLRQQQPASTLTCGERVYAMDTQDRLLVVATAERRVLLVDTQNPATVARAIESPLKTQTRFVTVFPDARGFAIGSIEGRCGMVAVDEKDVNSINFTFRCHREAPDANRVTKVHAVNDVSFHPTIQTTFTTCGSDGIFTFWDRAAHSKLKGYPAVGGAITSTDFNHDGSILAYAVGYDWSQGHTGNSPTYPNKLMLHAVTEDDSKPKKK